MRRGYLLAGSLSVGIQARRKTLMSTLPGYGPYANQDATDTDSTGLANAIETTLTASQQPVDIGGGVMVQAEVFNGGIPGPLSSSTSVKQRLSGWSTYSLIRSASTGTVLSWRTTRTGRSSRRTQRFPSFPPPRRLQPPLAALSFTNSKCRVLACSGTTPT